MTIRTYADALRHLAQYTDYERMLAPPGRTRAWNLARIRRLVAALGHPERRLKVVHVAGTKGKGSVCHMLDAILRSAGHRVGLYTSPHLCDLMERIRIDGRPLSRSRFTALMREMEPHLMRIRPTFFETMTALALTAFRECDWVVLEVGLGGRWDATNVVRPRLCVITRIAYDHTAILGDTLAAIAREKAGILKPGVPAITCEADGPAARVIRARARAVGAPLHVVDAAGTAANEALALAAARRIGAPGPLPAVTIPGRLQVLHRRPTLLLDVAHNPESMVVFVERALSLPAERRWLLFGASRDKDVDGMLALASAFDCVITTRARHPRAANLRGRGKIHIPDVGRALQFVWSRARRGDLIGVAGSFYVAGEVLQAWRRLRKL